MKKKQSVIELSIFFKCSDISAFFSIEQTSIEIFFFSDPSVLYLEQKCNTNSFIL